VPVTLLAAAGSLFYTDRSPFWRLYSIWAWSYVAAMTARNAFTHFPWYFVPILPVYTGSAARALEQFTGHFESLASRMRTPLAQTALAAFLGIALLSRMPRLESYLNATAAGREALYASVAGELAAVNPRCTVAATEIGSIGYHYPGRVLDLVGLVSPEVLGRSLVDVLVESRARWLVTYDTHFDRAVANSQPFYTMFERRSTFPVSATRALELYERRESASCSTR